MKCDDCLNLLEEYIDGDAIERDAEQVSAHLITCAGCTKEFEAFTAEREIFARYDRELNITPAMWTAIQARTAAESRPVVSSSRFNPRAWLIGLFAAPRFGMAFSGATAVLIAAIVIGFMYLRTQPQSSAPQVVVRTTTPGPISPPPIYNVAPAPPPKVDVSQPGASPHVPRVDATAKSNVAIAKTVNVNDQNDVLF
jgi:anti-sigma factor RsiW